MIVVEGTDGSAVRIKADERMCVAELVSEECLIVGGSVVIKDMCVGVALGMS